MFLTEYIKNLKTSFLKPKTRQLKLCRQVKMTLAQRRTGNRPQTKPLTTNMP